VLTYAYADSTSPFKDLDLPCDPRPYLPDADWQYVALQKSTAVATVVELAGQGFDVFLNLCDGAWGEDRPGIEVVEALERLGVAFTGATSEFYEPSREAMKRLPRLGRRGTALRGRHDAG
jgi:D-alanine-D-alanine ligase